MNGNGPTTDTPNRTRRGGGGGSRASVLALVGDWPAAGRKAGYQVAALAEACRVSVRRLEQFFLKKGRETPRAYLLRLKMEDARQRLEAGTAIKVVWLDLDYEDYTHFRRAFRRQFGRSPREHYRRIATREGKTSHYGH